MKVGDILITTDKAHKEFDIPKDHKFFKITELDEMYSTLISIQSEEVLLRGSIKISDYFTLLDDQKDNAVTKTVIGVLSSGFQLESFEAKTICGKIIKIE